jgi:hypothetical protein
MPRPYLTATEVDSRWYLLETADQVDEAEGAREALHTSGTLRRIKRCTQALPVLPIASSTYPKKLQPSSSRAVNTPDDGVRSETGVLSEFSDRFQVRVAVARSARHHGCGGGPASEGIGTPSGTLRRSSQVMSWTSRQT